MTDAAKSLDSLGPKPVNWEILQKYLEQIKKMSKFREALVMMTNQPHVVAIYAELDLERRKLHNQVLESMGLERDSQCAKTLDFIIATLTENL